MAARNRGLDRGIDGVFAMAMAAAAWLIVFGHRGVAPCVGAMALAAAFRREIWSSGLQLVSPRRLFADPLSIAAMAAALFSIWIAMTALWSPTPGAQKLGLTVGVSFLAGGALVFEAARAGGGQTARRAVLYVIMVSTAAAALMFEGLSGGYLRGVIPPDDQTLERWKDLTALGRGVTALAPLVFPAAVLLRRITGSWTLAFAPAALAIVAASQFSVFANVVALTAGCIVFIIAVARPRSCLWALTMIIVAAIVLTPFAAAAIPSDTLFDGGANTLPASWEQRLSLWREASMRGLGQCLPWGCGADYARAWSLEGGMISVSGSPIPLPEIPIHPHNIFIQIWLELGLPGVAAFATAAIASARALARAQLDERTIAAICGAVSACFISVMLEASVWQVWRLAVFALAAFGCAVSYSANKS